MNYVAEISNDQLKIAKDNSGLRAAFRGEWYAVGHSFDSSLTTGLTRKVTLSPCSIDTPSASVDCQKFIDKVKDRFQET